MNFLKGYSVPCHWKVLILLDQCCYLPGLCVVLDIPFIAVVKVVTLVCFLTGSLLNLAKHPSSTVQILGAEKALFRLVKKIISTLNIRITS